MDDREQPPLYDERHMLLPPPYNTTETAVPNYSNCPKVSWGCIFIIFCLGTVCVQITSLFVTVVGDMRQGIGIVLYGIVLFVYMILTVLFCCWQCYRAERAERRYIYEWLFMCMSKDLGRVYRRLSGVYFIMNFAFGVFIIANGMAQSNNTADFLIVNVVITGACLLLWGVVFCLRLCDSVA